MLNNSLTNANITVNNSALLYCKYVCTSNALPVWFIGGRLDSNINSDQLLVKRFSNRDETCRTPTAAHALVLHYVETLEIRPLVTFDNPIPVYCAYILVCNSDADLMQCSPQMCFSDSTVELQGIKLCIKTTKIIMNNNAVNENQYIQDINNYDTTNGQFGCINNNNNCSI